MPTITDPLWKLLGYQSSEAANNAKEQQLRAAPAPSLLGSLFRGAKDYIEHYSPAALAARFVESHIPSADDYDPYREKSASQIAAERRARVAQRERDFREQAAGRAADIARQDSPAKHIARKGAEFVGSAAGGLVSDPTNLIFPTKLIPSMAVSGGEDVLQQAAEKAEGVRDKIDPTEAALATVAGGVVPAISHVASRFRKPVSNGEIPVEESLPPEVKTVEAPSAAVEENLSSPAPEEPAAIPEPVPEPSPSIYRETSVDDAMFQMPHANSTRGLPFGGVEERYFATHPDLALGQGGNKGVLLEVDPDGLPIKDAPKKPGSEFVEDNGGGSEILVSHSGRGSLDDLISPRLRSITIKPEARGQFSYSLPRFRTLTGRLEQNGWERVANEDGSITWRRPEPAAVEAVAPGEYPPMASNDGGVTPPPNEPPIGSGGGDNGNPPPGGFEPGFEAQPNPDLTGSINRGKLNMSPEAETALKAVGEELPIGKEYRSHEETNQRADELNQNTDNFVNDASFEQLPEKVRAGQQGVRSAWENVIEQGRRGIGTDDYNKALADAVAVTTRHSQNVGNVGRGLNILREPLEGETPLDAESLRAIGKFAKNPDNAARLQELIEQHIDDAEALRKIARDLRKPKFSDYIKSAAYNAMLSGPATQTRNILGNLANLYGDIALHGLASFGGQSKKLWSGSTDRVMGREVLARFYGSYRGALKGLQNFKAAYREASPLDIAYREGGGSPFHSRSAMVLEAATRSMAAFDEVARMMARTSDVFGQAVRKAVKEGETGKSVWDRVDELVADPTDDMIKSADDYARLMRFQDEPGFVAKGIENMLRIDPSDVPPKAAAKLAIRLTILPFVRTPSSIIRTAARHSPLGVLSSKNWADFKAGGAARDLAVTRVAAGTALTGGIASMVSSGDITGLGPEDWRKNSELQASGWRPNSIKIGDKYVSYDNLGPLSVLLSSVATAVERLKAGELKGETWANIAGDASLGVADAMLNNGWMESLANFFGAMTGPSDQRETGLTNTAANIASSMTVPALIRQVNQNYFDPVSRETKGDNTTKARIENRIKAGIPGLSNTLPARHSPYGDEISRHVSGGPLSILNPVTFSPESNDPAEQELARLSASDPEGKPLVPPVQTSIRLPGGASVKLNGEDYQLYQAVTGDYIKIGVSQMMEDPDWGKLSDDSKRAIVKELLTKGRKTARTIVEMKAASGK